MLKSIVELHNTGNFIYLIGIFILLYAHAYCFSKIRAAYLTLKYEKTERLIQVERQVHQTIQYTGFAAICFGIMDCILGVTLMIAVILDLGSYPHWSGFLVVVALVSVFINSVLSSYIEQKASQPEYAHMRQVIEKRKHVAEKGKIESISED
jgi:hypothetical protein